MVSSYLAKTRSFLYRTLVVSMNREFYRRVWGMNIGEGTRISRGARLDKTNPRGIHIGKHCAITKGAIILTHDFVNGVHRDTRIGDFCFIGYNAVILPGVTVGDHCIVGTNAVVMKDTPPNCVLIGNPARVIEQGIQTGAYGTRIHTQTAGA